MRVNGHDVSAEMNLFKDDWCDGPCQMLMDEGDAFHFVDGEKWCVDCTEGLKHEVKE